ncbi:pentapeptide repeat-containing protein [Myxococcus sp. RHSTA-1-4]|uniref:pentapeptide repeat-containing protein n=1 Tax=Myxococcus sp. RHSTA-1-4 TaxID=2874601 RepID=UPI001CBBB7F3|nr:pentapeptide repeat-containing protein [Myxococcus sp. RHSTA-1-4]
MHADELVARWNTADGQRRREQLISMGLQGPWREVLAGFPGTEVLGDNLGDLRGIDLTQQELPGADLIRARLDGARLGDCGLQEARFEMATLTDTALTWARLGRANLTACVALGACWDDACMEGAVLTASNLARGSFRRARLRDARFDRATLFKADLRNADLRDTSLFLCDLEGALLTCVRLDPPRVYPPANRGFVREARRAGYSSFIEPILRVPGLSGLLHLLEPEYLLHMEAGVEASADLDAEVVALLKEKNWRLHLVAATAVVLGGASERALSAVWERLAVGSWVHPQLTVAALLRDPDFESRARARLEAGRPGSARLEPGPSTRELDVRTCLEWALLLRAALVGAPVATVGPPAEHACRWLQRLREQVDARIQAQWCYTPPSVPSPPAR